MFHIFSPAVPLEFPKIQLEKVNRTRESSLFAKAMQTPNEFIMQQKYKNSFLTATTNCEVDSGITDVARDDSLSAMLEEVKYSVLDPISTAVLEAQMSVKQFRQLIVQNLATLNNHEELYDLTALHIAVLSRNRVYLRELVRMKEIGINATAKNNITALLFAVDMGDYASVQILMQHRDIDINIRDADFNTALTVALDRFDLELINLLLKRTPSGTTKPNLPRIIISKARFEQSLFYKLNYHRRLSVSGADAVRVGYLLLTHGEKMSEVYKDFRKNKTQGVLFNGGPLEQSITLRNPELLNFFLQNLQRKLRPADLQYLWKLHLKCANHRLMHRERFGEKDIEFVNGTRVAKVLSGFIKVYEGVSGKSIPLCRNLVGSRMKRDLPLEDA